MDWSDNIWAYRNNLPGLVNKNIPYSELMKLAQVFELFPCWTLLFCAKNLRQALNVDDNERNTLIARLEIQRFYANLDALQVCHVVSYFNAQMTIASKSFGNKSMMPIFWTDLQDLQEPFNQDSLTSLLERVEIQLLTLNMSVQQTIKLMILDVNTFKAVIHSAEFIGQIQKQFNGSLSKWLVMARKPMKKYHKKQKFDNIDNVSFMFGCDILQNLPLEIPLDIGNVVPLPNKLPLKRRLFD